MAASFMVLEVLTRSARRLPYFCLAAALAALAALPSAVQAGTSTAPNPTVTFSTPGPKEVTLTVCNGAQCSTITQTVVVLDPNPAVTSATVGVATAEIGQLVALRGTATGKPPLAYSWEMSLAGSLVTTLTGAASTYWDTTGFTPGLYSLAFKAQNGFGTAQSGALSVNLVPETPSSFYTVTPCRLFDSRSTGVPLSSGAAPRMIAVAAAGCGIPVTARAIAANITVVAPTGVGHVTLFPGNYPQPPSSNINFNPGSTRASNGILMLATDNTGTLAAAATVSGSGVVHLLVDVTGYFIPPL